MKAMKQYLPLVLFIIFSEVVLPFKFQDEILATEPCSAVYRSFSLTGNVTL